MAGLVHLGVEQVAPSLDHPGFGGRLGVTGEQQAALAVGDAQGQGGVVEAADVSDLVRADDLDQQRADLCAVAGAWLLVGHLGSLQRTERSKV